MIRAFLTVGFLVGVMVIGSASAFGITLAAARAMPLGTVVTIDDLVLTQVLDQTSSATLMSIYGQDATGGVAVFNINATIQTILNGPDTMPGTGDDLTPGSRIDVTGPTNSFFGLFEIGTNFVTGDVTATFDGFAGAPAPQNIGLASLQDGAAAAETLEGMLVRLQNVTFTGVGNFAGLTNYTVTDGTLNGSVRVTTAALPIVGTAIPAGPVDIIGVVTQFDSTDPRTGGYQLLLSSPGDLIPVPESSTFVLAGLGLMGLMGVVKTRRRK